MKKEIRDIFWPQTKRDEYCLPLQTESGEDPYITDTRKQYEEWAVEAKQPTDLPEYEKTNRENKLEPKLGRWYCRTCDANMVGDLGKCGVCGKKPEKRTIKIKVKKK